MNPFLLLIVSALVSVHQYIPSDDTRFTKYYTDVRDVRAEEIFPAANQSCQYLYSVFVNAGVESAFGGSGNPLTSVLGGIIGSEKGFQSALNMVHSPNIAERLVEKRLSPEEVKDFLSRLCSKDFNPIHFSPSQRQQTLDFIKEEIAVLDADDLKGLGESTLYGNTRVYDANLVEVGEIGYRNKDWTPIEDISPTLTMALIAAEDEDFFSHRGVDTQSIARIIKEVSTSDSATGGSTVTMQLLKNLYFAKGPLSQYEDFRDGRTRKVLRKVREWYYAWPYERQYGLKQIDAKYEVLENYFNVVEWGARSTGIFQASKTYFGKKPSELNFAESAYLVSLLKAPNKLSNPRYYATDTLPRRNDYVLERVSSLCSKLSSGEALNPIYKDLCRNPDSGRTITPAEIAEFKEQPLPSWERPDRLTFNESMNSARIYVNRWLNRMDPSEELLIKDLHVQTTINQNLQEKVFTAVKRKLDEYDRRFNKLANIIPAFDDRSKQATARTEDLGYRTLYRLNGLVNTLQADSEDAYLYSMNLDGRSTISLSSREITDVLKEQNWPQKRIKKATRDIRSSIRSSEKRIGVIKIVRIGKTDFEVLSLAKATEMVDWQEEDRQKFLEDFSRPNIETLLHKNVLARLDRYKHRDFLVPIVVNDRGLVLDKDLNQVKFTPNHNWYFKTYLSIANRFYWARPTSARDSKGRPLYEIDAPRLQAAAIVLDANSGAVLANFGGYNPKQSFFDRSMQSERQVGSTVKPWVYFTALNKGFQPGDVLINDWISFTINNGRSLYRPRNFSGAPARPTLRQSLVNSYNIATFSLLKDPRWSQEGNWTDNFQDVRAVFEDIGLYDKTRNNVSVTIGAQETSLARLASTYTYFANGKNLYEPHFVAKAVDSKGNLIFENQAEPKSLYNNDPYSIFNIQLLLAEIANAGTAASLKGFVSNLKEGAVKDRCFSGIPSTGQQNCLGGKTGTTNSGRDAWFIGFSRNFVIGVWVGYDENIPIPDNPTGGKLALPIFKEIISEGFDDLPKIEPFISTETIPVGMNFTPGEAFYAQNDWQPDSVQSRPKPAQQPKTANTSSKGSCWCTAEAQGNGTVYWITASYGGRTYSRIKPYNNLQRCKRFARNVKISGKFICK